jgi:tetratricopeptide (TPR) repeat protein
MRIALLTPGRKAVFGIVALTLGFSLLGLSAVSFLASHFAQRGDASGLKLSTLLVPENAAYHDLLGHYLFFVEGSPDAAMQAYQRATTLDPYASRYWLDQAVIYELLNNQDAQSAAIEHALAAEPTNPGIAWEAATFFLARGQNSDALLQLRRVMEGDPSRASEVLETEWRVNPDVRSLLRDAIPAQPLVYWTFLDYLNSQGRNSDAFAVWSQLLRLKQPLERPRVFGYVEHLLNSQDVSTAQLVWQQAAPLCDLTHYQPGPANLVVNGDFSLDILNAGFDWRHETRPDVTLSLDPTETHGSQRSLLISFEGQPVSDTGVRQFIPVQPNSDYYFSAYSKTQDLQGAGGPRFVLRDAFTKAVYFSGQPLTELGFWKETTGAFHTGNNASLLLLQVLRVPENLPIRGKLWIGSVGLAAEPRGQAL